MVTVFIDGEIDFLYHALREIERKAHIGLQEEGVCPHHENVLRLFQRGPNVLESLRYLRECVHEY